MTTSLSSCTLAFFLSPNPPPSFPAHTALFSHSFPELLVITTVKQEQMCGYQCGIITHHCSTVPAGHRQPEGQIPPCSLCSVAELSCCHGLFHTDTASFSSTWQQKHLPSSVDLGNHSVNGASEIFWDVDISGISICSACCFFPYGSGDLTATYPFMCKTLPIA